MDDIDRQIEELKEKLDFLREQMPITPLDAERKAMEVGLVEEQLAELYEQKIGNTSIPRSVTPDKDSLTEEIKSITDELMEIEIKMIKAEMDNDDSERVKLQMSANALKARRQTLIDEVREMNSSPVRSEQDDLLQRVEALEKEVADLKTLLYQLLTRQ
jgi:chromosome segregation ATPase